MTDTKAPLLDDSAMAEGDPNQVADMYADRLMDEIFGGVERALEGDTEALKTLGDGPVDTPEAADPAMAAVDFSPAGLPALAAPVGMPFNGVTLPSDLAATDELTPPTPVKQRWWQRWTVNGLLLGAAGLSLAATLALWWAYQRQTTAPAVNTAPAPAPEAVAVNGDAEFLEYLRRSLSVIAQDAETSTVAGAGDIPNVPVALNGGIGLPPIGGGPALGSANVPGVPGGVPGQINVIERVYIPYQTGQVATVPSGAAVSPSTAAPAAPGATVAVTHTLVGVLELGDRSAALFEINGVPQRVYIGERIGSSGWSLVSVSDGEVVVRRNGEVRSIYIGQRF
jgi:hypothetical protein